MTLHELNKPVRRGLARLRGRVRSILAVLGTSRVLVAVLIALVGYFFLDYMLRLPLGVRRILCFLVVSGTLVLVYRRLVRPMSFGLTDEMLAARVERTHPQLENRLSSSLAFARAEADPDNDDSPELMRAVVEETAGMAGQIPFADVARTRRAMQWAGAAIGILLAVAISAVTHADVVSTFLQRSLLLKDIAWPRRTTLTVVGMRPGEPRRVTRGREATVEIRATGSLPDRVVFTFWEKDAPKRTLEELQLTPSAEDHALFTVTLPVYASYDFTVAGGDDDREMVYSIEALTPPSILSVEMDVTYPAYLKLEPRTLSGGDQRLPVGSKVNLRVKANMALREATLTAGKNKPVALTATAPDTFALTLEAKADLRYSLRLKGPNGEENDPVADTFILRVLKDQAPVLRVRTPSTRAQRRPKGFVLLAFNAQDDYEVVTARLVYKVNDGKERVLPLGESGGSAVRLTTRTQREPAFLPVVAVLDIALLRTDDDKPLAKGDQLVCQVEATDSAGQTQRSRSTYRIDVVDDDSRHIDQRQGSLRESVDKTAKNARKASTDMDEVRVQRGRDATEFRRWTGRAQAAQARVLSDLDSLARAIREVFNLYVFNRLESGTTADQMLPYYERHLLESAKTGTAFTGALYRDLWRAQNERAIRARGALAKLLEMADLSDRLAADHAPRAYKAIARIGNGGTKEEVDATIAEAIREQKEVGDGLALLARLMREWQSFEGVVRYFKDLQRQETDFREKLKGLNPSGKTEDK